MPATRSAVRALIFEGLKSRDGLPDASASADAEVILAEYERALICNRCGSSIHRHDSRHLLPDPISIPGTDH